MSRGKRYSNEGQLNYKKVFAVIIAIVVLIMVIFILKNLLTKAKNTKTAEVLNYFVLFKDDKWGILGSNGETIIEPSYQEMPIVVDKQKDVFLCTYDVNEETEEYKTKAINSKNEEVFTQYDKIEALENYDNSKNIWYESNVLKVQKDGKWGLIDLDGKQILDIIYDNIETIKGIENSIIIEKDGSKGLVNNKGLKILEPIYSQIMSFGDDYKKGYITINSENKYGIVKSTGEVILDNKYDKIENIYSDKCFVVVESGKQKLIDITETIKLQDNFDEIKQIANSGIVFVQGNKYGVMNFLGEIIIDANYEYLKEINTDIFVAKQNGKYGVIDINKEEKIPYIYKEIIFNKKAGIYIAEDENYNSTLLNSNFENKAQGVLSEINIEDGYLKLRVEDEYKYYNFKFEEKDIKSIFFKNKLFTSKKDGKYGFVDSKGNVVVDYIYDNATEPNKYGYAGIKKDGLWGAIDKDGNVIINPCYNLEDNLVIDFIGKWHLGIDLNMNYYCDK